MKTLFWILLAANLGAWMWWHWEQPPPVRPPLPVHADRIQLLSAPGVVLVPRLISSAPPAPQPPGSATEGPPASAVTPAPSVPQAAPRATPAPAPRATPAQVSATGAASDPACLESPPLTPAGLAQAKRLLRQWKQVRYHVLRTRVAVYQVLSHALTPYEYAALQGRLALMKVTAHFGFSERGRRWVSYGVFQHRGNADHEVAVLRARGLRVHVVVLSGSPRPRVILQSPGPLLPRQKAALMGHWSPLRCPVMVSSR